MRLISPVLFPYINFGNFWAFESDCVEKIHVFVRRGFAYRRWKHCISLGGQGRTWVDGIYEFMPNSIVHIAFLAHFELQCSQDEKTKMSQRFDILWRFSVQKQWTLLILLRFGHCSQAYVFEWKLFPFNSELFLNGLDPLSLWECSTWKTMGPISIARQSWLLTVVNGTWVSTKAALWKKNREKHYQFFHFR